MKQSKTLQKLTDYENINSVSELKNYLELYPENKYEVDKSLRKRIEQGYNDKKIDENDMIEMLLYITDEDHIKEDIRNTTYETNHSIITSYIHNYLLEFRTFPTMSTISNETNLSRQTIYNHLNKGFLNTHNKLIKGKNEIMSINALQKLYLIGIEDRNPTALKHFIQLSGLTANSNTMQVNNYIQINNLKISTEDIKKLPIEDILEIEKIVSKTLLIE
jgi:DNA-binding phage protein